MTAIRLWLARCLAGRRYVVLHVDTKASVDRMIEERSRR